ncbi:2TM domain-containing protein [Sabulilitoribacter multivorans]|uniref:2TM domain-containing protein n=1 Tax=Flaviramulus multivorans TaxID=1304750 RepID=A0ABS9IL44_9FLAO|nr:2TM domain-containing protein [Flaviramulus multivorans]MCF7561290.1 2TM domain-containing protein [Flaviramulus multivorans]
MENYNIEPYNNDTPEEDYFREKAYLRAKEKVKKLIGFYWHLASYVVVNLFIIILIVSNGGKLFSFGTFATALFWGIGLFFHFLGVFGPDFMFGKNWEQRKIKEYMDKEQNTRKFE